MDIIKKVWEVKHFYTHRDSMCVVIKCNLLVANSTYGQKIEI